jgi:hypothetical protein
MHLSSVVASTAQTAKYLPRATKSVRTGQGLAVPTNGTA